MTYQTFEAWNATCQTTPEADVPADHNIRDMGVTFDALHHFGDGAWIAQLPDGRFWSLVQFDDVNTDSLEAASRWLWDHFSSDIDGNS